MAKILDLGLSKNIEGGEQSFYTQTGVALGTPHYISPEQAKGEKGIDGRTDIYSLGATFYHLVTGQTPFQGSTAAIIMMKHLSEELPNPQDINPDIPDGVAQVIARMMAKDPADRYANCKELLDDLEMVIDGKTPSSQAIDAGKSSVAVARSPHRATAGLTRSAEERPTGGRALQGAQAASGTPHGTRQQQPVAERRRTGHHAADAVPMQQVPGAAAASRRNVYIAAGVLGLGAITFIAALAFSGKPDAGKSDATKAAPDARTVTPDTGPQNPATVSVPAEPRAWPLHNGKEPVADYARRVGLPATETLDLGGGVKMEFVLVPAGEFMMGDESIPGARPVHKVRITKPFYMGKYEGTVAQFWAFADAMKFETDAEKCGKASTMKDGTWQEVGGVNWRTPGFSQDVNYPACVITWNDAQEFCKWAAKKTGRNVCLPTEAQWEYACRAGTATRYNTGDKDSDPEQAAWFDKNSGMHTDACGQKKPNAWGLYDMHGNVWEWVQDYFNDKYYADSPPVDPKGPAGDGERVRRGGGWPNGPGDCRSAVRIGRDPGSRNADVGFRVSLDVPGVAVAVAVRPQTTNQKPEAGVTDAWIKMVQAQPAEKQVEEVVKKLKELNPGFDGKVSKTIDKGCVAALSFSTSAVEDLSPVRALKDLKALTCCCQGAHGVLADLTPLSRMALTYLECGRNQVSDLSPLRGSALTALDCSGTYVSDLSPLKDLKLAWLNCGWSDVSDLTPLRNVPLQILLIQSTKVRDLSPLKDTHLRELHCDFNAERDAAILRSIKTLEKINGMPVAEFWKKVDAELAAKAAAGAERPWKPIFDGKRDCSNEVGNCVSLASYGDDTLPGGMGGAHGKTWSVRSRCNGWGG